MCGTVYELSLNLVHKRCQKLDRRPKTITRPELTNRAEKKHALRQIETTSRLMDDWRGELWWYEDDKRLRKKVTAPQSGAPSGRTSCPNILALWIMEYRWREQQAHECFE